MSASGRSIYWDNERPGAVTPEGWTRCSGCGTSSGRRRALRRPRSPLDFDRLIGDYLSDVMDWRPRTPDRAAARSATLQRVLEATLGTPSLVLHADALAILWTEFPDIASHDAPLAESAWVRPCDRAPEDHDDGVGRAPS